MQGTIVTIGGTPYELTSAKPTQNGNARYVYTSETGSVVMTIRQTVSAPKGKPTIYRHNVELIYTVNATPTTDMAMSKVYFTIERTSNVVSTAEAVGLFAWATANSAANLATLLQEGDKFYLPES